MSDIVNTTEYAELTNAVQAIKGAILQSQQHALCCDKPRAVGALLWNWTLCFNEYTK